MTFFLFPGVVVPAGKSSSIVETSSSPQTSILLQTEPTSSSMSVVTVKTADLGISSTEYRETTSPATVYHSPSNWLVTTPSSIAESDIVKPMLAPSNTTDKDKTSLYPLNTMPIEKSTFTKMRSESTDYKLSRRITTLHKTEPQQTRAIPEILSSGVETIMAPSTTIGKDKTPLHPSSTMLIKKSTSTDMRLESTDYRLSGQITSSYKTESQQTTAIPEILSPGIKDTSSPLTLTSELVHSPFSVLSSQLTTAAENRRTTPWVQVPEMISYSKATKSLKLSTSSKSSSSFPASSPSVLSSSLLSLPTSFLLSHRGTTETTLLAKSTHSSFTPVRSSSNAEQAAVTNSTVVTSNSRTERPTSSDSEMTSSLTNKIPRDSMPPKNAEAQSEEKGNVQFYFPLAHDTTKNKLLTSHVTFL